MIILFLAGLLWVLVVSWDVFETVVLPRRVERDFRLTRYFFRSSWALWNWVTRFIRGAGFRETFLGLFGPLALITLFMMWGAAFIWGYALMHFAAARIDGSDNISFGTALYYSGTTFFTLGLVTSRQAAGWRRQRLSSRWRKGLDSLRS